MVSCQPSLIAFMRAMHEWELRCAERERICDSGEGDYDVAEEVALREYSQIFGAFCSRKAVPRGYFFTEPPDYDPIREVILSERQLGSKILEIFTQQKFSHRKRFVYIFVLEDSEWRLLERRIRLDDDNLLDTSL